MKNYIITLTFLTLATFQLPGQNSKTSAGGGGYGGRSVENSKEYAFLIAGQPGTDPASASENAEDALATASAAANGSGAFFVQRGGLGSGQCLVIPKDGGDAKSISDTEEDLKVMAHIIQKTASSQNEHAKHAMGIVVHPQGLFGLSSAPQDMYIEGYGALFFLEVNFPLSEPPSKKEKQEPKDDNSVEWEKARRELDQPSGNGFQYSWYQGTSGGGPVEPFDADRVEELKKDLASALKNASHIRKLKSDESVTIIVSGSPWRENHSFRHSTGNGFGGGASSSSSSASVNGSGNSMIWRTDGSGGGHKPKMIVHAKKSDIDAFQKDKMSLDDFRKKLTINLF